MIGAKKGFVRYTLSATGVQFLNLWIPMAEEKRNRINLVSGGPVIAPAAIDALNLPIATPYARIVR